MTETFAPSALVFDMDGLLLDTERIALDTFQIACRAHGVVVEKKIYYLCIGSNGDGTREILQRALGPDFPYEAVSKHWMDLYHARVSTQAVDLKDGALALLELVRARRLPVALATSTHTALATTKLRLAGLDSYFSVVIGGDAVARGKPHPEPYLAATGALGVAPNQCWAVEDSDNGVRSAHAAGLFVLQVPDLVRPSDAVRGLGHVIVNSLYDVAALLS